MGYTLRMFTYQYTNLVAIWISYFIHKVLFIFLCHKFRATEIFALMKVIIYITKQSIYIISYVISNDTTHMIH